MNPWGGFGRSLGLVVAGVVSEHVVELDVVDFVGSTRLEAFVNQGEFELAGLHFEVVEDRSEAGHVDEARVAAVLVLEEGLDQQAAVSHGCAQASQASVQVLFLFII